MNRCSNLHKKQITMSECFVFHLLFIIFYLMNTQIKLPYNGLLRWVILLVYLIFYVFKFNGKISKYALKKSGIVWIVVAIIPRIFSIIANQYALMRTISLLIVLISFSLCINQWAYDRKKIKKYFNWFSNLLILASFINSFMLFVPTGYEFGRFRGGLSNANGCAIITIFALICAMYKIRSGKKKKIYLILSIVFFAQIIATQSRMAFFVAAFLFLLFPILTKDSFTPKSIVSNLILLLMMLLIGYYIVQYYDIGALERMQETENTRSQWGYAYTRISDNPVFGVGYSISAYHQQLNVYDESWRFFSSYLEFAVDCGIYGLVIMLVFFFSRILSALKCVRYDGFVLFLLVFIVVGLVIGISESYLFAVGNPLSLCFWFVLITLEGYCSGCEVNYES